jgi:DNA-binding MarR family transcriptional regulator
MGRRNGDKALEQLLLQISVAVWRAAMPRIVNRMAEESLTFSEVVMLHRLRQGSCTIAEVAECLHLAQPSTASRTADRLVRDGLVARQEDLSDRRQKRLSLTERGLHLVGELTAALVEGARPLLVTLSPAEQSTFCALLEKIVASAPETPVQPLPATADDQRRSRHGTSIVHV